MKGIEKLQENNDLGEPELNSNNNNSNDNDKVCATTTSNINKTNGVNAKHTTTNGTSHNGTKDKNKQQ